MIAYQQASLDASELVIPKSFILNMPRFTVVIYNHSQYNLAEIQNKVVS